MRNIKQPKGLFPGKNFMTPDILGYYKLREGYAELSQGTGLNRQPIYGVTVRPDSSPSRSALFHSMTAAVEYIEGMS